MKFIEKIVYSFQISRISQVVLKTFEIKVWIDIKEKLNAFLNVNLPYFYQSLSNLYVII